MPQEWRFPRKCMRRSADFSARSRNGSDGISFIQTAEGALTEVEAMLQRCRELSVQASNDVTTLDDKKAIQQEIEALMSEIDPSCFGYRVQYKEHFGWNLLPPDIFQ